MSCRSRNHQSSGLFWIFNQQRQLSAARGFFRRNVVGFFLKLDTPATPRNDLAWFGDQGAQSINGFMENWNSKTTAGYTGNFPMNQCRESDVSCQKDGGFELVNGLIISLFVAKVSSTLRVWPRGWFSRCLDASAGLPSKYGGVLQHFAETNSGPSKFLRKKGWPFWMIVPGDHL